MAANIYTFVDPKIVAAKARHWLIKINGDKGLSEDEVKALQAWIQQNPLHQQELLRISKFWKSADALMELAIPLHQIKRKNEQQFLTKSVVNKKILQFSMVVTLIFFITLGGFFWPWRTSDITANGIYVTAIGEQKTKMLTDGSTMQLNTDSQVQVSFNQELRKIRILRGEAYFDVTKDADRPFAVYAGNNEVLAVGTSFSVRLINNQVKVMVSEGKVNLSVAKTPPALDNEGDDTATKKSDQTPRVVQSKNNSFHTLQVLESGQSALFGSSVEKMTQLNEAELRRSLSWREGMLTFYGDSLSQVVKEINRYTPITIDIVDPAVQNLSIGGRFPIGDIEALFEVLEMGFNIDVQRLDDQHVQLAMSVQSNRSTQ